MESCPAADVRSGEYRVLFESPALLKHVIFLSGGHDAGTKDL